MEGLSNFSQTPAIDIGSIGLIAISAVFIIVAVLTTILGLSSVYVLIRNGRSRTLSFVISAIYMIFYSTLMLEGISLINALK